MEKTYEALNEQHSDTQQQQQQDNSNIAGETATCTVNSCSSSPTSPTSNVSSDTSSTHADLHLHQTSTANGLGVKTQLLACDLAALSIQQTDLHVCSASEGHEPTNKNTQQGPPSALLDTSYHNHRLIANSPSHINGTTSPGLPESTLDKLEQTLEFHPKETLEETANKSNGDNDKQQQHMQNYNDNSNFANGNNSSNNVSINNNNNENHDDEQHKRDNDNSETSLGKVVEPQPNKQPIPACYNQVLDDEIRSRLDKLNALSNLINSLECQFDDANRLFRDTLKCSTERLSCIAKTLGTKSINYGRKYHAAKIHLEQSQSDCQRACVQFEQANQDHQIAKRAIEEAEQKLHMASGRQNSDAGVSPTKHQLNRHASYNVLTTPTTPTKTTNDECSNIAKTSQCDQTFSQQPDVLAGQQSDQSSVTKLCSSSLSSSSTADSSSPSSSSGSTSQPMDSDEVDFRSCTTNMSDSALHGSKSPRSIVNQTGRLSEELNHAILRLIETEKQRGFLERQHMAQANRLMVAQDTLFKLERDYGASIRRSQLYFDESKRFNERLSAVKCDISRVSAEIIAAKQAYSQTLKELEQFSEELHHSGLAGEQQLATDAANNCQQSPK